MYGPGTLMPRFHHGFIGQDSINACLLAKRGITGPIEDVLTGPKGFLNQFSKNWKTDPSALTKGLGEEWEMTKTMIKSYVTTFCAHAQVYGTLELMKKHDIKFGDIESMALGIDRSCWNPMSGATEAKYNPKTAEDCRFSVPYVVATAAHDGGVFIDSFTPKAMSRAEIRALMAKISMEGMSGTPNFSSKVTIKLKNGSEYSGEFYHIKGHPKNPFTKEEFVEKFKICANYCTYKLSDDTINSVVDTILNLERAEDVVASLIQPLTPD